MRDFSLGVALPIPPENSKNCFIRNEAEKDFAEEIIIFIAQFHVVTRFRKIGCEGLYKLKLVFLSIKRD